MKVIIYTLTPQGEIPAHVTDGGYFSKPNELSSPQDFDLVGIATDEATETELHSKDEVIAYVASFLDGFAHPVTEEVESVESVVGDWCDIRGIT